MMAKQLSRINPNKPISLRLILVVPFLLQIVLAVGLTGWFSLRNGEKAINVLVTQLETEVSDRIDQHLDNYLSVPHQINQINADAVRLGLLNLKDFEKAGHYCWKQMQVFNVGYIYYVLASGEYAGAGIFEIPDQVTIDELSPATGWRANAYVTDSQGNRIRLISSYDNYDPQSEAAYTDAVRAKKPIWSQIYQWDNFPDIISISASYPLYDASNALIGVLVTNLRLSQISHFLRQIKISASGKAFVLERNGLLVASSSSEQSYKTVNGKAQRLKALDSTDPMIRETTTHLLEHFGNLNQISQPQSLSFQLNNQDQFVRVTPWRDQYGLDWLVVVTLPKSDFMAEINQNTRTTLLLCLGALILATLLGIYTSHWITKPIWRLNKASQSMASGELDQQVSSSGIKELGELAQSFNQMAYQLRDSFMALEENKEQLEQRVEERTAELKNTVEELKQTQTQMIQAEKMSSLGQLVAGVAHEINNPINFIHGNLVHVDEYTQDFLDVVQLYQTEYPKPTPAIQEKLEEIDLEFMQEDLVKMLASMRLGSERIREIVKSLRTFSRLDEAEMKPVDIHTGIDSTLLILQHRLKQKSEYPPLTVIKNYGDLPFVECYPGQLNQVFMNILSNAIDAIEENNRKQFYEVAQNHPGQITIRTSVIDLNWIEIAIADNGYGMPEEVKQNIFNPFFTTKPIGKGTGLGLSISYQIITEKHQGHLKYISTLGQGTEFIIQIPIQQHQ